MKVDYVVSGTERTIHAHGLPLELALSLIPDHGRLLGVQYE